MRAEHLDHLGVREVQRPSEVVVDEILPRAGVDHEHRARRVGELARVVEDLVAVVALAIVGRVGTRLEQHPRQLGVAGDPGGAVQRDLEPLAAWMNEAFGSAPAASRRRTTSRIPGARSGSPRSSREKQA